MYFIKHDSVAVALMYTYTLFRTEELWQRGWNRFSNRRICPLRVLRLWIFAVNRADSRILKTQWTVDQLRSLARIPDCACLDVRILGLERNLDHRSFFSLGRYINEFIQIIYFFELSLLKRRCETVIGIVLCYSHQACCLLYYLCEINYDIHFTFELLHFLFPDVVVVSNLNKNIGGLRDLAR